MRSRQTGEYLRGLVAMPRITEGQYALGGLTIFVVWVFFVLPFLYQTPISEKYDHNRTEAAAQSAAHQEGHHAPGIATPNEVLPNPNTAANEPEKDRGEFWSAKLTDWLLAIFTLFLVFFTARLCYATAGLKDSTDKLWDAGERQMELIRQNAAEQSRDMQASIVEAKRSADAAVAGADVARQALVNAQRAFVFINAIRPNRALNPANNDTVGWFFQVEFKNSGNTPTKSLRCLMNIRVFDGQIPDNFDFVDNPGGVSIPAFIAPQRTASLTDLPAALADIEGVVAKSSL
jgi:hypothetical protein